MTLTTTAACGWATTVADSWISLSQPAGTGPATVMATLAANPGVSRFGWAAIEGRRILVRQSGPRTTAPPEVEQPGVPPGGVTFPEGTFARGISADGRFVAFDGGVASSQSGTITRVYLRDRLTGTTIDVSAAPGGPVNDPSRSHSSDTGVLGPDYSVSIGAGASLSEDGPLRVLRAIFTRSARSRVLRFRSPGGRLDTSSH